MIELENVKEIQTQKLVCIKNGVSRELTAGVDYETCEVEKENGWKKYAYRIKKETSLTEHLRKCVWKGLKMEEPTRKENARLVSWEETAVEYGI